MPRQKGSAPPCPPPPSICPDEGGVLPPLACGWGGWRFYSRLSRRTHLRANCRRYSDRALIQCSRRGLSRQIYIGSHGRFTWVHRTCSANEVSKKVPFPCWESRERHIRE